MQQHWNVELVPGVSTGKLAPSAAGSHHCMLTFSALCTELTVRLVKPLLVSQMMNKAVAVQLHWDVEPVPSVITSKLVPRLVQLGVITAASDIHQAVLNIYHKVMSLVSRVVASAPSLGLELASLQADCCVA